MIPSFPEALGIFRSLTRVGVNWRCFRLLPSSLRNSLGFFMEIGDMPSTPAVLAPLLPLTLAHAT